MVPYTLGYLDNIFAFAYGTKDVVQVLVTANTWPGLGNHRMQCTSNAMGNTARLGCQSGQLFRLYERDRTLVTYL